MVMGTFIGCEKKKLEINLKQKKKCNYVQIVELGHTVETGFFSRTASGSRKIVIVKSFMIIEGNQNSG